MVTVIKKFIEDNNLDFTGSGSDLNGNCVILAGFICYNIDAEITGVGIISSLDFSDNVTEELLRVFQYAWRNNYEDWWKQAEAHTMYIF